LEYCKDNNLPFLQGTTLWGVVNRTSWYNDDYIEKYGDLTLVAKNDLPATIQLCAQECSQGRTLKPWELRGILAYLWSIQIKINNLTISPKLLKQINSATTDLEKKQVIEHLKSLYSQKSSAHFITPKTELPTIQSLPLGDPKNGQLIYEISCKVCHQPKGSATTKLTSSKSTKNKFLVNLNTNSQFDLYKITRKGTHPSNTKKNYMPLYSLERLSSQQLKDLIAYLTHR